MMTSPATRSACATIASAVPQAKDQAAAARSLGDAAQGEACEPRISFVVPTLNEARGIVACLASLQPARARGHEVVLVDGGSDDGTPMLARPWVDRVVFAERGRAAQMNAGARVSTGVWLVFVHGDTRVSASALVQLYAHVLGPKPRPWGRFRLVLSGRGLWFRLIERLSNLRSRLTGVVTGDQGLFVARSLFEDGGGYPSLPLMEDLALSRRLRRHCRPVRLSGPLVSSSRRWERCGVLRTIALMWLLRGAFFAGVAPERLARWYREVR